MSHESGFRPTILTLTGPTCSGKSHLKELLVATGVRHLGPRNRGFRGVASIWIKDLHATFGGRL